jgi:phage baseplate assembly protein W
VSLPHRMQGHTFGALRRNEPRVAVLRETLEGTAVGPGLAQEYADEDYSAS